MRNLRLLSTAAILLPLAAHAQQDVPQDITLDEIIITGGLSPIEADAYGRSSTVITSEQIQKQGWRSVREALRVVPGVAVTESGESLTQLRIRGGEANHVQILIDGVRAGAGDQEYYLTGLDTDTIDRIEVLRGPQSVFYGADASSGVINIITRKGGDKPGVGGLASVELGNGWAGSVWSAIRADRGGMAFSLSSRKDKGYDYSATPGGDLDGIRRISGSLSGDYEVADDVRVGFTARRASEEYQFDGTSFTATTADEYVVDSGDYADRDEFGGQLYVDALSMDGRLSQRLSYDLTKFRLSQNGGEAARARTEAFKYRGIWGLTGGALDATQTLAVGLEHRQDENSVAREQHRQANSVALEYRGQFDALDVQAGARRDFNSLFGNITTWSLGLSYRVHPDVRVHASAGTGSVNPTYIELFGGFGTTGNPNLTPEENRSIDLGVETRFAGGRGLVDVTVFNERLHDEISYVFAADGQPNYVNESGVSKRRGVEISGRYDITPEWRVGGSYTYLDAKNPNGSVETRRPRHDLAFTTERSFAGGRGSFASEFRFVSHNYDTQFYGAYATEKLPDYSITNVSVGYDLTPTARLTGRVTNLFDNDHVETWGYVARGRTAYVGLETRW